MSNNDMTIKPNSIVLPIYSIYLIGFVMVIMLIAIICLALALYIALKKKQVLGISINNKQYVRQESTGLIKMHSSNYEEHNKNNGSTLTVNSGIIEINRISEPSTPTRVEDSKIIFPKKPTKPTIPIIQRGQMDEICKEVLRKVQKSDSASFRDLNELLNGKSEDKNEIKCKAINESEKENKNKEINETLSEPSEQRNNVKTEANTGIKIKPEAEMKDKTKSSTKNETKNEIRNDVKIEVNNVSGHMNTEDSDTDTEYDTVPSPVRFRRSGSISGDFDADSIPMYDLPPRNYQRQARNVVQMDPDSYYLLPFSTQQTNSCYINAKRLSHSSS